MCEMRGARLNVSSILPFPSCAFVFFVDDNSSASRPHTASHVLIRSRRCMTNEARGESGGDLVIGVGRPGVG